jgi:Radical SAM superfamily
MKAVVNIKGSIKVFDGKWIDGSAWQRFGLYNTYVVIRNDGRILKMPAHAGELVPGATEDLHDAIRSFDYSRGYPAAPLTLELDPTFRCASRDCGGACFSARYRSLAPSAMIPAPLLKEIIQDFHNHGGRIVRFDGGGDPLLHPAVLSGEVVEFAAQLGLKTTILTSGDWLHQANLGRIAETGCYLRLSLNAATDKTRRAFHGNRYSLTEILVYAKRFVEIIERINQDVPVGATFLLSHLNYKEVLNCAYLAREAGIRHFSVRRILGPPTLRPHLSISEDNEARELLAEVKRLHSNDFRVAIPWRATEENDLNPKDGDFEATQCWQSTFKSVMEPDPASGGARVQLCGRYRGSGVGQRIMMEPILSFSSSGAWISRWQESFHNYPFTRQQLLHHCVSCIDRGFIVMMDRLLSFLKGYQDGFRILHLDSPNPYRMEEI